MSEEMGLTNGGDASVPTLGGLESSPPVSDELLSHIDSVLSPKETAEEVADEPAQTVNENVQRQVAVNRKQQKDELVEEGLETADGSDPENPESSAETETDEQSGEAPAEELAVDAPVDLDPNLRFVAQFYGWKDDRIDKLFAADPELATETFSQLLNAFQAMSRQQGVGLPSQQQRTQTSAPTAAQPPVTPGSHLEQLFANPKAFADANGEQLGQLLVGLQQEVYQPLRTAMRQVAQIQAEYMVQKQQAVAAEATTATAGLAQKFPEVYGVDSAKLNLFQQQARQNLFTVADQLRAGAYQQGKEMTVSDALSRAHLIVTAGKQQAAARKEVRNQVQQRSRKITARPTQRANPRGAGVAKGEQAAIEAYQTRASELGIGIDG